MKNYDTKKNKKASSHARSACDETSYYYYFLSSIKDSSLCVIFSSQGIFEIGIGMTSITNISKKSLWRS